MSFFLRIKSHHADLAIAYRPWVYTSSKGLIPQRAYNRDRKSNSKQAIAETIKIRFLLQNVIINRITKGGFKHWS